MGSFYRHYANADCAFMNSGNFRADCLIPIGGISVGTLTNVIQDGIVVKIIDGNCIIKILENMVSMYPNLAGRFSALSGNKFFYSGLSFTWNGNGKVGERVKIETVKVCGE